MKFGCIVNCFTYDGLCFFDNKLLLVISLHFLSSSFCFACSCSSKDSIPEAINNSDVVFYGKVLSKEFWGVDSQSTDRRYVEYEFKVSIFYKIKFKYAYDTIKVLSGMYVKDDCAYFFEVGNRYIVYANWHSYNYGLEKKYKRKFLYTDACDRTVLANHHKNGELLKIERYLSAKHKKIKIRCVKYIWFVSALWMFPLIYMRSNNCVLFMKSRLRSFPENRGVKKQTGGV